MKSSVKNKKNPDNKEQRYSILGIEGSQFAVAIANVKEVIPFPKYTKLPNVSTSIMGVFNLRGQIYSIIDLCQLLKLDPDPNAKNKFVVMLEYNDLMFGVPVERVMDVVQIAQDKIVKAQKENAITYLKYLNGYLEDEKMGKIFFLNISGVTKAKEIIKYRHI